MIRHIRKKCAAYWSKWVKARVLASNPQQFSGKNIYILPSGFGWAYALLVLSLFSAAINYQISAIFLMTFILAMVGMMSAWEAHNNLNRLSIKLINVEDATVGIPAKIILLVRAHEHSRFAVTIQLSNHCSNRVEQIPPEGIHIILPLETSTRGRFLLPPILISSTYPLGVFRVWGYAFFEKHYYVYPQPVAPGFWPLPVSNLYDKHHSAGSDEFYELQQVEQPWSQPNLIAWKIAAKGQGWFLKDMRDAQGDFWSFRLKDLPAVDLETKLQYLSYWLHQAEQVGYRYNLELTQQKTAFAGGEHHLQTCLRQLALYK